MTETIKVLAKSKPDKAACIQVLLMLGLWDAFAPYEREAFIERGEVLDTPAGRVLFNIIRRHQPS